LVELITCRNRSNAINPLTVNFLVGGTATLNTDYTQSGSASFSATTGSITFAAGVNTASITIDPKIDLGIESNETVTITLLNGTDYKLSGVNTATGTITNDDLAGVKIIQTASNSTQTNRLLSDNFTVTGNPNTSDLNYNLATRQAGSSLGTSNWVRSGTGTTQVGNSNPNIDSGNYLLISNLGSVTGSFSGTAALDRNFNGVNAQGGLRISFDLAPNITGDSNQAVWGSFNLGLSATNKNAFVSANVPHFGILFRGNGVIRAFDGGADITGAYSSWGDTSNNATTRPFSLVLTDPTDDNPFDGVGQTNIDVYRGNTLIYSYVKGNGGYSDNYLNFGAFASAGIDNLVIEKASGTTVTEGGATDTYSVVLNRPPIANVTLTLNSGNQFNTNVSSLIFTPSNWNVAQTVTVSAINDSISEGIEQRSIIATLTSTDPNYNNITLPVVPVTIIDNDLPSAGIRTYAPQPTAFSEPLIGFGEPIKPTLVDLDGDRDLDLVVISLGLLAYYENTGSLSNPIYTQKNVADYGLPNLSPFNTPVLVNSSAYADLDGDRDLDLVIGFRDGTLQYYKNTGTVTNPNYVAQTGNNNPFNTINIGSFSPTLADLDGDGDQDLIIGEKSGKITYYKNQGTFTNPVYVLQSGTLNPFATVGEVGTFATPYLTDEDGDGDYDLIVGLADGTIKYYKNEGTASNPNYVAQFLNSFAQVAVNGYASPVLGDIDGDGDRDLIVGTGDSTLKYFANVPVTPQSDLTVTRNSSGLIIVPSTPTHTPTLPSTAIPVAYPFEGQGTYTTILPIKIDSNLFNIPTNLELEIANLANPEPPWYDEAAAIYSGDYSNWATLSDLDAQVNLLVPYTDRVTYRGTLLSYILIAAQKPVEDLTPAERKALDWVNIRIQQNRILQAKKALDYYDNWKLDPYSYRTPSGFGFDPYPYTAPSPGLGSIFLPPAPDVRRDAKAVIHRDLITTFQGQIAAGSLTKGVQRYKKEFVDIVSLIETLQASGLSQDQIYNTVLGTSIGIGFAAAAVTTAAITISYFSR
jgi:hypothetical protein